MLQEPPSAQAWQCARHQWTVSVPHYEIFAWEVLLSARKLLLSGVPNGDNWQMNAIELFWWGANIGSDNYLVPLGIKPLPEPMLTRCWLPWCRGITRPQWVNSTHWGLNKTVNYLADSISKLMHSLHSFYFNYLSWNFYQSICKFTSEDPVQQTPFTDAHKCLNRVQWVHLNEKRKWPEIFPSQ